jgi:hypothetical protein
MLLFLSVIEKNISLQVRVNEKHIGFPKVCHSY